MRRRRRIGVIAAALAVAALCGLPAGATAAPCPPDTAPALTADVPFELAYGRSGSVELGTAYGTEWSIDGSDVRLVFEAADPSQQISHPFDVTQAYTGYDPPWPSLLFDPGDGSGKLTATWQQKRYGDSNSPCEQSLSQSVVPLPGDPPYVRIKRRSYSLEFHLSCSDFSLAAGGTVGLVVSHGRQVRRVALSDQCEGSWDARSARASDWSLAGVIDPSWFDGGGEPAEADFWLHGARAIPAALYKYRVVLNGVVFRRGSFMAEQIHLASRVYEGTDAFINYCVNHNEAIRSHHGRLYCWRDPARDRFWKIK